MSVSVHEQGNIVVSNPQMHILCVAILLPGCVTLGLAMATALRMYQAPHCAAKQSVCVSTSASHTVTVMHDRGVGPRFEVQCVNGFPSRLLSSGVVWWQQCLKLWLSVLESRRAYSARFSAGTMLAPLVTAVPVTQEL